MNALETNRELLLSAASRLFHHYGSNIPLEQVLQAAEVSQAQFDQVYSSQQDLVAEVAGRQMDRVLAHLEPFVQSVEKWEDLEAWKEGVIRLTEVTGLLGCPVGVIALDATPECDRALASVQAALNRFARMHVKVLARLKDRGVFVESFDPRQAVQFAGAVLQGSLLLTRAYQDASYLERNFGTYFSYLETFRAA